MKAKKYIEWIFCFAILVILGGLIISSWKPLVNPKVSEWTKKMKKAQNNKTQTNYYENAIITNKSVNCKHTK